MYQKYILDDLDGFQFEELVADIFRKKGFTRVVVTPRTNDGGKDITMDEITTSGEIIRIIVECKHHKSGIGRPVVQKLHSAVSTLECTGKKKGYIVSSSTFTDSAIEYVQKINNQSDNLKLELIDGKKLKEIASELGVDLKNGIIEAVSNESIYYSSETVIKTNTLEANFYNVSDINKAHITFKDLKIKFYPIYYVKYNIDAQFSTSVGIVHEESREGQILIDGRTAKKLDGAFTNFLLTNIKNEKEIRISEGIQYDKLDFQANENELKTKAISEIIDLHEKVVRYTGKNNISYKKVCTPSSKDIIIHNCKPVYYPEWTINIKAKQKSYLVSFIESNGNILNLRNDTRICQNCNRRIDKNRWYCNFCGSIICKSHLKITRLGKVRICTNCSITKSFFGAKKYFESDEELKSFESYYESLPLRKKIMENPFLVYSTAILLILIGSYSFYLQLMH